MNIFSVILNHKHEDKDSFEVFKYFSELAGWEFKDIGEFVKVLREKFIFEYELVIDPYIKAIKAIGILVFKDYMYRVILFTSKFIELNINIIQDIMPAHLLGEFYEEKFYALEKIVKNKIS